MRSKLKKMTFFGSNLRFLVVFTFLISACGKFEAPIPKYVYENPTSGHEVALRPSNYKQYEANKTVKPGLPPQVYLDNPKIVVRLKEKTIQFKITKTEGASSEEVELVGTLDDSLQSWMRDSNPVDGTERLKAYARCLNTKGQVDCTDLYIDVYYNQNGEIKKTQFIADSQISPAEEALAKMGIEQPANSNQLDVSESDTAHGIEEDLVSDGNGAYVSPAPAVDFLEPLIKKTPAEIAPVQESNSITAVEKDKEVALPPATSVTPATPIKTESPAESQIPEKKQTPTPDKSLVLLKPALNPTLNPELNNASDFPFNLLDGGRAEYRPNRGNIADFGTMLPAKGDGYIRVSPDQKAYATGFLSDFIQVATREYIKENPSCGKVAVRNLSQAGGGQLRFNNCKGSNCYHKSHQNGLDADVAYLPHTDLKSVMSGGKMKADFAYSCNYNFIKYLNGIKLPSGENAVYLIFVHTTVKRSLCMWSKAQNLTSAEDKAVFNTLSATSDAHHDHMHVRLRCSPGHMNCWQGGEPDNYKCE